MNLALVTGGRGFVGAALTAHLRRRGWDVVTADRHHGDSGHVQLDVTDTDAVARAVTQSRPDVVFHPAGPLPQQTPVVPAALVTGTVGAALGVCTGMLAARLRARLVMAGSAAQYGPVPRARQPIGESTPCAPVTAYGLAKHAAEATAAAFAAAAHMDVVLVRVFNVLGSAEPTTTIGGVLRHRVTAVLTGDADTIEIADPNAIRDFTDVRDVARGYLAAAEQGRSGHAYNLCSGRPTSVRALAETFVQKAGLHRDVLTLGSPSVSGGPEHCVGSAQRASVELGWHASTALSASVSDALAARTDGRGALT